MIWFLVYYCDAWFRILVSPYGSISAIEFSAWLNIWMACDSNTFKDYSHGDGKFVIACGPRWEER